MKVLVSKSGKKYHAIQTLTKDSVCGTLKKGKVINREEAEEQGYEPCSRGCGDSLNEDN